MEFIILLICLGAQRYLNIQFSIAQFNWFKSYHDLLKKFIPANLMQGLLGLLILVLPASLLVAIVGWIVGRVWLLALIYGVVVLFYCLDGRDLGAQFKEYLNGEASGAAAADAIASDILAEPVPAEGPARARAISNAIFFQSLHHVFGVIFWYVLLGYFGLGLFGAFAYFLTHYIASQVRKSDSEFTAYASAAGTLEAILAYVPVRILGFAFGVVGSFGSASAQVIKHLLGGLSSVNSLAALFGLAALNADVEKPDNANIEENKAALNLVFMATGVWLVIVLILNLIKMI